jgi:hypothetical protein
MGAEGHPGLTPHRVARVARRDSANRPHLPTLRSRLSEERLAPFDSATGGDLIASLRLYEWNIAASAAFFESLHVLEVVLRNALHEQLAALHHGNGRPGHWYEQPDRLLSGRACEEVTKARRRVQATRKPESAGRVVAELPFGFWRYLTTTRYAERLWRPALRRAFPARQRLARPQIADRLTRLHLLRDRIAHHEPIHRRELRRDWQDVQFVASAICPHVQAWIRQTSRVEAVLAARPGAVPGRRPGQIR